MVQCAGLQQWTQQQKGTLSMNFVVIGAGGYIAERHMRAIAATGHRIVAVVDPNDSGNIGKVDTYSADAEYFPSFDELLAYMRTKLITVHYVSVCSPSHLHFPHCLDALYAGADVICEKPTVIDPDHLSALAAAEIETGKRVSTVLQFRLHPQLVALREELVAEYAPGYQHDVTVSFILPRGKWYAHSWKAREQQSGCIAMHLGIHIFDLLLWLFGEAHASYIHCRDGNRMAGFLELERARVRWFLSSERADLSLAPEASPAADSYRSVTIGSREVEFSEGREALHTAVYQKTLTGQGFGLEEVRPAIELVHQMGTVPNSPWQDIHPFLRASCEAGVPGPVLAYQ